MNTTSQQVKVRVATHSDYEAVMDINRNVYTGFDYLPRKYFEFMGDPSVHLFVAEIGGKVVGFAGAFVFDNNNHSLGFAGRTHPDYQRQGISNKIMIESQKLLKTLYPHIKYSTYAAVFDDRYQHRLLASDTELLYVWNIVPYICTVLTEASIKKHRIHQNQQQYQQSGFSRVLSNAEAVSLLIDKSVQKRLFKDYSWFLSGAFWYPHLLTGTDTRDIKLAVHNSTIRGTFSDMAGDEITGISFDSFVQNADGVRIDVWFYGEDENTLVKHVVSVLEHDVAVAPARAYFIMLEFPPHFSRSKVVSGLHSLLGLPYRGGPYIYDQAAAFKSSL